MPPVLSKEYDDVAEATMERELVKMIAPVVFLNVISGSMLFTARPAHLVNLLGSPTDVAAWMSSVASGSALVEFLVNPFLGKLSDAYGRRAIAPVGNLATVIFRLTIFLNASQTWPVLLEQLVTIPLVTSFFTTFRASLSDLLEGPAYARTQAKIGVGAGLGIIVGPLLSKVIMRTMDVKYCFLLSSILSSIACTRIITTFQETLPLEKRKAMDVSSTLRDAQPFSFVQVMRHSPALRKLLFITGLQTSGEGRNVNDTFSIFMQQDLKWSWDAINNFIGAFGISLVVGGLGVKQMISNLGLRRFTTVTNLANTAQTLCWSTAKDSMMILGMLFGIIGGRKRDAVESLVMKLGSEAGFGKGFLSGVLMNWRAIINIIGPLLVGRIYAIGSKRGTPGLVFLMVAFTTLAAEGIHQSITNQQLGVDAKGVIVDKEKKTLK